MLKALEHLGLDEAAIAVLRAWRDSNRTVTLRLTGSSTCTLARNETREVESNTKLVTERSWVGKTTTKVVTTVTDYFWTIGAEWKIEAVAGTGGKSKAPAPHTLHALLRRYTAHHQARRQERFDLLYFTKPAVNKEPPLVASRTTNSRIAGSDPLLSRTRSY